MTLWPEPLPPIADGFIPNKDQKDQGEDEKTSIRLKRVYFLIEAFTYGYRKIHDNLRDVGESCGQHRVVRLMQLEGLRTQTRHRRRPGKYGGMPTVASPNLLKRQFVVVKPNKVWVTDITYIRTYECRLVDEVADDQ